MSDQKSTPEAVYPPPEKESTPGAFPDLSAHSDSPAWLSEDGNHDAGVWERSFEGAGDADMAAAEGADGAGSAADAPAMAAGTEPDGDETAALDLPPEPVVVAPEELELEEPSLAEPALSDDAVEAASLDQVVSETAAAEADAAEAGRLSGLEPAPAGTEVQVDANAAGANEPGETDEATTLSGPTPEDGVATASESESAAGTAVPDGTEAEAVPDGAEAEAVPDGAEAEAVPDGDTKDSATPGDGADNSKADGAEAEDTTDSAEAEAMPDRGTEDSAAPGDGADDSKADGSEGEAAVGLDLPAPGETPEPAAEAEQEPSAGGTEPHPLHGINAAAPMTAAPQERTVAPDAASGEPEPVTAAVPAGDTRRSRRLAESQAAGATAASKQSGAASGATASATGAGTPAGIAPAAAKDSGKSKRNTRLLLVLGGVVLAAVVAILLFVFVFNGKEEGVISEDVSPLELADGACLKDWDDVNSSATVVTCETPHNAQLVATDSFTEDAAFPGTGALEERVSEVCAAVEYADAAAESPGLKLTKSIPTEQTWASGDRRVDCIVFAPEGQELTESLVQE
ncbi:septum formation family protein [Arthrobacter sp. zg-Y1110]|uniref:septum formation family protein n=1 Tax=Arthrobacter sp. zg-Y1110 TaxID=2886932 RepID=UPI001D13A371|nr:septum formation family protein [Arthrobacter sp. zg-Y1110]MCC3290036.1 septum formation family protein [Arthrobacter sp. zg-Y1110]UWX84564.1 septum formation family protein [Arthrobacter sp. zg-Y1110]